MEPVDMACAPPMSVEAFPDWCLMPSPLFLDGWLEFNRERWGLEPRRVRYTPKGKDLPTLDAVLYLDRRGRVRMPPRNPYLPIRFTPSTMETPRKWPAEWLRVSAELAEELRLRGVRGPIALPPGFIDGREFGWRGLRLGMRYTFVGPLPHPQQRIASAVREKCRKAERLGYRVARVTDWDGVARCLAATGEAKGFSHRTGTSDLRRCAEELGEEHFYAYAGFSPSEEIVCAQLRIKADGGIAMAWSAATHREHLSSGINQLVTNVCLRQLSDVGAVGFDMLGANMKPIAAAKAAWGFQLMPYLTVEERNARSLISDCISMSRSVSRWAHALRRNWPS